MNAYFKRIQHAICSTTRGMTSKQLQWCPEGKWSTAEILEHLLLTYRGTVMTFNRCLTAGNPMATLPLRQHRLLAFIVVKLGYMPKGREAPAFTRPKGASAETIVSDVLHQLAAMDEAIWKCEQRLGSRVKLANHPVLGPLTACEWRKFHWVHARHHLRQIERLKKLAPVP